MSMNKCFKCGDIYDTDFQMEMIDGEMVCDRCYEDNCCCDCGELLEKDRRDTGDDDFDENHGICYDCKDKRDVSEAMMPGGFNID